MSTTEGFDYQAFMQQDSPELGEVRRGPEAREQRRRLAIEKLRKKSQSVGVLEKIQEIVEVSAPGDFLYRGEPRYYDRVSSSLYRKFGATNLINFTGDCLIAIFFACDASGFRDEDGRVVVLRRTPEVNSWIRTPRNPETRVLVQKSIFVQPPDGLITPDHVIKIPKSLKKPMLGHLRKYHGISTDSMYNDLQGKGAGAV